MPTAISLNRETGDRLQPEGLYRARILKVEEKSGPSGFPYMVFHIRLYDPRNNRLMPGMIWDNVSLSPAARFRVDDLLNSVAAPETGNIDTQWFVDKDCWVVLGHEEYNGRLRAKVSRFVAPDAAASMVEADPSIMAETPDPGENVSASQHADVEIEELDEEEFPV